MSHGPLASEVGIISYEGGSLCDFLRYYDEVRRGGGGGWWQAVNDERFVMVGS